jgi:hypothetical protein
MTGTKSELIKPLTWGGIWWAWEDLNLRPLPYQGSALTV